jgi:hypothetical protein
MCCNVLLPHRHSYAYGHTSRPLSFYSCARALKLASVMVASHYSYIYSDLDTSKGSNCIALYSFSASNRDFEPPNVVHSKRLLLTQQPPVTRAPALSKLCRDAASDGRAVHQSQTTQTTKDEKAREVPAMVDAFIATQRRAVFAQGT